MVRPSSKGGKPVLIELANGVPKRPPGK